jgi:hypothetical protein
MTKIAGVLSTAAAGLLILASAVLANGVASADPPQLPGNESTAPWIVAYANGEAWGSNIGTWASPANLNSPIVGLGLPRLVDSDGFYEVASDGGVFARGDVPFDGSMGGQPLNSPIVGMAMTQDGNGYYLFGADGGVFSFGSAQFYGSLPGQGVHVSDIVGMAVDGTGDGYWLLGADGGVFAFGDAPYFGRETAGPALGIESTLYNTYTFGAVETGGYIIATPAGTEAFGDPQVLSGEPWWGGSASIVSAQAQIDTSDNQPIVDAIAADGALVIGPDSRDSYTLVPADLLDSYFANTHPVAVAIDDGCTACAPPPVTSSQPSS